MMQRAADNSMPPSLRRARIRLWLVLWASAGAWIVMFLLFMRGFVDTTTGLILLGAVTIACLSAAGWSNHRLTMMDRSFRNGRCWHCAYDLRGSREPRCPECGAATEARGERANGNQREPPC